MRRLCYNVAMSLDGYIARPDGSFDWITEDSTIDFAALFGRFDTLLMGKKTFNVLASQPSGGPFDSMLKIVVTHDLHLKNNSAAIFVHEGIIDYVSRLKAESGKDIWLFGGGALFCQLLDAKLVETVEVAIMPILLGEGIPMLAPGSRAHLLTLVDCERLASGICMLKYDVANGQP
jgi:dihydrofolate reductase